MKILSFIITVGSPSSLTTVPVRQSIINSFDHIGRGVGVSRLNGESNIHMKKRIWDVSVHPYGPTRSGVMNSLSRDFGFIPYPIFKIGLKLDAYGEQIAESPRIDILSNKVILYSSWSEETAVVDKEIRTYKKEDAGYFLQNLIDEIDSSSCFSCEEIESFRGNGFSSCLFKKSSCLFISSDSLKFDRRTHLTFNNVVKDSLQFNKEGVLIQEVTSEPTNPGEYSVDYKNGIITSYDILDSNTSCSYYSNNFPMQVEYSPVQLFSLNDDNFVDELYEKQILDSGEEIRSILNKEGTDIYHTLYKQSASLWGE